MLKKIVIFLVLLIVFFVSSRTFFNSTFFYTHDFTHGARVIEMYRALKDGHVPVRWTSNFGYGYGMPLFEFYAPLPYYFGALLLFLGFSLVWSVKLLFLITNLVTIVGGYKLGKSLFGRLGGLLLATSLTLAPYRAVNMFVRGAISELWAMMVLPFILYGIVRVVEQKKNGVVTLLVSLVVLLLSHNLTTMMFLPLSIVFGASYLLLIKRKTKKKNYFKNTLLTLATTYGLSLALTAFYWLPALLEKDFTKVSETVLSSYFNYQLHFVYFFQLFKLNWQYGGSSWGSADNMSFYLGTGQLFVLLMLFIFLLSFVLRKKRVRKIKILRNKHIIILVTSLFLMFVSLFMLSFRSRFVWQVLQFLSFIQFPWRWLSLVALFLSISISFLSVIKSYVKEKIVIYLSYLVIGMTILLTIVSSWSIFKPESYLKNSNDIYYSSQAKIRSEMSGILPDYIPINMQEVKAEFVVGTNDVLRCEVDNSCSFEFEKLVNRTQEKLVKVKLTEPTVVEFATAYFPGWLFEVNGEKTNSLMSEFGLNSVSLDKGEYLVSLQFANTLVRNLADLISILALIFLISWYGWYYIQRRKVK